METGDPWASSLGARPQKGKMSLLLTRNRKDFFPRLRMRRVTGRHETTAVAGEEVSAFVPCALPPIDPPLVLDDDARALHQRAEQGVARLELAGEMVPSVDWFVYAFVRKEAVVSSQIEGTQCTLIDLLTFEAEATNESPIDANVQEVCNYLDALAHARQQIASDRGLPISMRLLNETHGLLMRGVRGADKQPGEVRRSQNWIGGTRPGNASFVPPPPHLLSQVLAEFEEYLHAGDELPPLVRAGLLHVQFETIHPYLDGNGRIGRLLVTLLLEHLGVLRSPLLYLSLFFKRHRDEYYRRLSAVRTHGDWEGWNSFFLEAVATIADEATGAARDIFALVSRDRHRVLGAKSTTVMAARLFEQLPHHPIVTIASVTDLLETTKPTASKAVAALVAAGILVETTGRKRDRTFRYAPYLELLRIGTELESGRR
jgi:Fic family protein